jgi:hypothetical protein
MNFETHKQNIVESAIQGLTQGGIPGSVFTNLLERVYDSGYNECRRENESLELQTVIECLSIVDECYSTDNESWNHALEFIENRIKRNFGL